LVFQPASEMENRNQNKKHPVISQQTSQHYHYENGCADRPGSECLPIKCHERIVNEEIWTGGVKKHSPPQWN
jgi:hypothetical protein